MESGRRQQRQQHRSRAISRTGEIVLGIVGGIFGLISAIIELFIGSIDTAINGSTSLGGLMVGMFIVCIAAIILPFFINKQHTVMGILILLCGLLNFVFAGGIGILSGILIAIAGILAIVRH